MSILLDADADETKLGPCFCSPIEIVEHKWKCWESDATRKAEVLGLFQGLQNPENLYEPPKKYICWEIDEDADAETRAKINGHMEAINARIAKNEQNFPHSTLLEKVGNVHGEITSGIGEIKTELEGLVDKNKED